MIRRLFRLYRPYAGWLMLGGLLSLAALLANVGLLALSGWFIASMALAGAVGASMNYFTPAAIIRALAIVRTAGRYGERVVTHEATFRVIAALRTWLYARIEPLAPGALEVHRSGDLLSRLQKDIDRLDAVYLRIALPVLVAALGTLLSVGFMALHEPRSALLQLVLMLVGGAALPLWINRMSGAAGRAAVGISARLRTEIVDNVQGMGELLACNADARAHARLETLDTRLLAQQDRLNRARSLALAGQGLLAQTATWGVLLLAIPAVAAGSLPPANLAMLALFSLAAFEALAPLPDAFALLGETRAAAERLFGLADTPDPTPEPPAPQGVPAHGTIRLQAASLRYPGQDTDALHAIDLELPPGSRTLVRGASGAGKSSLVQLLLRFRDPTDGGVSCDGTDLRAMDSTRWRDRIAVVSQHTQLIAGTVRDNLLLARPDAVEGQIEDACRQAQVHAAIVALPDGYDTWLGDTGVQLSGGEARRLAIARAVLRDAPILLLDEPTEGLDRTTERDLIRTLGRLLEGRTVLMITHRALHLPEPCRELELDAGRLIEPFVQPTA